MTIQYIYPRATEILQQQWYDHIVKFGNLDFVEWATQDATEIRISWRHGRNHYFIANKITREMTYYHSIRKLIEEMILDMVNVRDTHIKNITFWTNCKDVR